MFYVKLAFMLLWTLLVVIIGLIVLPFRQGDRGFIAWFVRLLSWGALRIAGLRVTVENEERLVTLQPCVYLVNHQSVMDLVIFGVASPPGSTVVAKAELRRVPLLGRLLAGAGFRFVERRNPAQAIPEMRRLAEAIKNERLSVAVAPEGTRNLDGGRTLLPFKHGAFYLAIQAKVTIVPLVCEPIDDLISFSKRRLRRGDVRVRVLEGIPTQHLEESAAAQLAEQTREKMQATIDAMIAR